ncbi:hypothetical protein F4775DRAFT_592241 [Biscogniauxia sp. FL1348]|nr:hypothetical protein F4775DRAFT_592241 [Biscogniauxia sp. FL1348]
MTDWKGIVKNGWHPEKEGSSLKGQVKGLLNRGGDKPSESNHSSNHSPVPITSLRDPSSFGPPPKHVGSGSGSHVLPPPSSTTSSQGPPLPSRGGGPPNAHQQRPVTATGAEDLAATGEPKPFRADNTGLSTSHLPPPPLRSGRAHVAPPPRPSSSHPLGRPNGGGPPMLPPRLPPRNHAYSPSLPALGAPHQLAADADGISGPGFGFNMGFSMGMGKRRTPPPPLPPVRATTPMLTASLTPSPTKATAHLGDMSMRYSSHSHLSAPPSSRPGSSASSRSRPGSSCSSRSRSPLSAQDPVQGQGQGQGPPGPNQGTTWAQKQAALKTAADFHRDPTSVSLSDARAAASTANNFRQRHGDQVVAGARAAHSLNERYGVTDKMTAASANHGGGGPHAGGPQGSFSQVSGLLAKKKKPPFPPPNKISDTGAEAVVPPVPLATRPRFG